MNLLFKIYKAIKWRICFYATNNLPIKRNSIIMSSYYGREYGDIPKYIAEAIHELNPCIKIYWVLSEKKYKVSLPDYVKPCLVGTFKYYLRMNTSAIWIDNCRNSYVSKRKEQLYIQTWHGGGGQKKCELDAIDTISPGYVKTAKKDSCRTDLMISESKFMTDLYFRSFWYSGPVFECGYPRYDIVIESNSAYKKKVCDYYKIDYSNELLLYAPTFRDGKNFDAYSIDFERLRDNLKKKYGLNYVILVHLHPNVASVEGGITYDGINIINSTYYADTQELLAASSILIGDYSSINYDFCLKRKPVIRYCADLEKYKSEERGFYFSFDDYPFPYAKDNNELEKIILEFDESLYLKNLDNFTNKMGSVIEPNASQKLSNLINDYIISGLDKEAFLDKNRKLFVYKQEANS